MKKAAEYFIIFIMIQFIGLTLANGVILLKGGTLDENQASAAIGMDIANFILVIAVFVVWLKSVPVSAEYIKKKPYLQLLFCVILGFATLAPSALMQQMLPVVADNTKELFEQLLSSAKGFVVLAIIAPITEEIVFRGAVLGALKEASKNKWTAIIISALFFAVAHFNPAQFTHALLIGILLGWLCVRTGSIIPGILIHIINNGAAFVIMNKFPDAPVTSLPVVIVSVAFIIISLWCIVKCTAPK